MRVYLETCLRWIPKIKLPLEESGESEVILMEELKAEIRRVNALLRETHNPREYRQNKKYLERLERELRQCQRKSK